MFLSTHRAWFLTHGARRAAIRLGQLGYLQHFNRPMNMEPGSIQAAARAHAEQALAKKHQFTSMRAFLVGLLSSMSMLLPLNAPTAGYPTLHGQPDILASDLHYVQSAPGCPLIFYGLNPVGICNIGVCEGQLVLKLKDVVSTAGGEVSIYIFFELLTGQSFSPPRSAGIYRATQR